MIPAPSGYSGVQRLSRVAFRTSMTQLTKPYQRPKRGEDQWKRKTLRNSDDSRAKWIFTPAPAA
ncbi:hypothetical protein ARTHRO9V_240075 [Arthrobacter sp. 9V]|nr:hypothetical protein ARTHRO9V_240075 [Arthrobacter sp. 9V]